MTVLDKVRYSSARDITLMWIAKSSLFEGSVIKSQKPWTNCTLVIHRLSRSIGVIVTQCASISLGCK